MDFILLSEIEKAKDEGTFEQFLFNSISEFRNSESFRKMLVREEYAKTDRPEPDYSIKVRIPIGDEREKTIILRPERVVMSNFIARGVNQIVARCLQGNVVVDFPDNIDTLTFLADVLWESLVFGHCWVFCGNENLTIFSRKESIPIVDDFTGAVDSLIRFYEVVENKTPTIAEIYTKNGIEIYHRTQGGEVAGPSFKRYDGIAVESGDVEFYLSQQLDELPLKKFEALRLGQSMVSNEVISKQDVYDKRQTLYFDEFNKTHSLYWEIENYNGDAKELLAIRNALRGLGLAPAPEGGIESGKIRMKVVEYPWQAHKEATQAIETAIFRDLEVTNLNAITVGNVTATAIRTAQESELSKAGNIVHKLIGFVKELLDFIGFDSDHVQITPKQIIDLKTTMDAIKIMVDDVGVPIEVAISHIPILSKNEQEKALDILSQRMLGFDTDEE